MIEWSSPPAQAARRLRAPVAFLLPAEGPERDAWGLSEPFDEGERAVLRQVLGAALGAMGQPAALANGLDHPGFAGSSLHTRRGMQSVAAQPCGGGAALCVADFRPRPWTAEEDRVLAAWARILESNGAAFDPATGALQEPLFLEVCRTELKAGLKRGLILCELVPHAQLVRDRGVETADRVLRRLAGVLRSRTREYDLLGRLTPARLALWLPASATGLATVARKLNDALLADFRFPTRLSAVAAAATLEATVRAAEAGLAAARRPSSPPRTVAWEQRYQRLVLLHRVALRLFGGESFHDSLGEAGEVILALAGARRLVVHRMERHGSLVEALRRGGRSPADARLEAAAQEEAAQARAAWRSDGEVGWLALPIPGWRKDGGPSGILSLGYDHAGEPDTETRALVEEAALLLRNAFAAQDVLREQRLLAAVTEQSADPVILTDLEGRVTAWSSGAESLFGWTAGEIIGRKVSNLYVPDDEKEPSERLTLEALGRGFARDDDAVRFAKDGRRIPVATTVTVVRDEEGNPFGMVRILRDITRLKELDRMKSEFVQLVTHELRSPMTSIRGFAETLLEYSDQLQGDEAKRFLGIIVRESKRLGRLVTDFLDASRLEAGSMPLKLKTVDLQALAQRVATVFEGHPAEVTFQLDVEPGLAPVTADEDQIERVLINLCGNALKYSPAGGTITLGARRQGDRVAVIVSDQGPGMAAETRSRLFQKFYRAKDSVAQKTPGTGLGLYIAKTIVEAHGGTIRVDSEAEQGTRMVFELPVDQPAAGPGPTVA